MVDILGVSIYFQANEEKKDDFLSQETNVRFKEIQKLAEQEMNKILSVVDSLIRIYKRQHAYQLTR